MVAKDRRDSAVEWLRVAGAAGIVWFHAGVAGSYWGYAGLVVFLLLSMMFEAGPNIAKPPSVSRLAKRLLVPWLVWWVVFGALNIIRHLPIIDTSHGLLLDVLASPSIHLWYLPFVFGVIILFGFVKGSLSTSAIAIGSAVIACALIWAIPLWRPLSLAAGYPLAQWAHAAAPVFTGILFGCAVRERRWWLLSLPIAALLASACFGPFPTVAPIYLLGAALVAVVVGVPPRFRGRLAHYPAFFWVNAGCLSSPPLGSLNLAATNREGRISRRFGRFWGIHSRRDACAMGRALPSLAGLWNSYAPRSRQIAVAVEGPC